MIERQQEKDIRAELFDGIKEQRVLSAIRTKRGGVIFGIDRMLQAAEEMGITAMSNVRDGMTVAPNETIAILSSDPHKAAIAEEQLVGIIAKPSGVATAAAEAVKSAQGKIVIVSGAAKKLPVEVRALMRRAVLGGGAEIRISPEPFVYLDKNYIRIFGSIRSAVAAAKKLPGRRISVQLRNEFGAVTDEALEACEAGADILMLDTGDRGQIAKVSDVLKQNGLRDSVQLAFAGDVCVADIPSFLNEDVDILCIGRDILDAPMMDLSFDVLEVRKPDSVPNPYEMNLLEKSELFIENVEISSVNLNQIAEKVSEILGIERRDVLVVDVRPTHITLDLLCSIVDAKALAGSERKLLDALGRIEGFRVLDDSYIHSNGVLGLISLDEDEAEQIIEQTASLGQAMRAALAKRACVFPTGFELERGMIQDTNSPYIAEKLQEAGYTVKIMPVVPDDQLSLRNALEDAVSQGFSLIITSGGVGAEDKDKTVEAVLELDPTAAAPWLVKYQMGSGRHTKHGVRIAVADLGGVGIVALPGPNDEVRLAMDALLESMEQGFDKYRTAQAIATVLRRKLQGSAHKHETPHHERRN